MLKTKILQMENGVYCLEILHNDEIIAKFYNEFTEEHFEEMADIAELVYGLGKEDGYNECSIQEQTG